MFCRECGKEVKGGAIACLACGVRPLDGVNYCQECGAQTKAKQVVCIKCGMELSKLTIWKAISSNRIMPSNPPRSPVLALIFSLFVIGVGQIYLGQVVKGITLIFASIVLSTITFGVAWFVIGIISCVDAYKIGRKLESGKSVDQWEFF